MDDESTKLNPYAPSTLEIERTDDEVGAFPEQGIDFAGALVLRSVKKTHHGSLLAGALIAFGFICFLIAAAFLATGFGSAVVLVIAAAVLGLALFGFVHGQSERPLAKFDWMQGSIAGTLRQARLDVRWNDGESAGSLAFPARGTQLDFLNRHGRLFVIRNLPCFIPKDAVSPSLWPHVKSFRAAATTSVALRQPPVPNQESAQLWHPCGDRFSHDRFRHDFLCAAPGFSRVVCLLAIVSLSLLFLMDSHSKEGIAGKIGAGAVAASSALFWISRVGMRRNWWSSNLDHVPAVRLHAPTEPSPNYIRWIDSERLLVGFQNAWICVPWSAIFQTKISLHAIEFSVTPSGVDAWYLERGDRTEAQWQQAIQLVLSKTLNVSVWGSARNE